MNKDDSGLAWLVVALMLITLFAHVKISHSEIRDLQRRVGESASPLTPVTSSP